MGHAHIYVCVTCVHTIYSCFLIKGGEKKATIPEMYMSKKKEKKKNLIQRFVLKSGHSEASIT